MIQCGVITVDPLHLVFVLLLIAGGAFVISFNERIYDGMFGNRRHDVALVNTNVKKETQVAHPRTGVK